MGGSGANGFKKLSKLSIFFQAQYRYAQAFYELGDITRAKETNRAARKICSEKKDLEGQFERFEKGFQASELCWSINIKFYMYLTKLMSNIWSWVYICEFRLFWCNIETSAFVPSLKCLLIFCWHLEIVAAKFQFFHIGFYESRILPFTNFQLNLLGNSLI